MSTCGMFVYFRIRFFDFFSHFTHKMFYKKQDFKTMLNNSNKTFMHKYEIR